MLNLVILTAALAYWRAKSDESQVQEDIARNQQNIEIKKFCVDHYKLDMKDEQGKQLTLKA